jgi:hypothetical protein
MKIIINDIEFQYNIGCRILKNKYGEKSFPGLEDIWDDIQPMKFVDIVQLITNIEQRRVAFVCLGFDKLVSEVDATLIDTKTMDKSTLWIDKNGELVQHKFVDTYELFEVKGEDLFKGVDQAWGISDPYHFVKFKDTSTDRIYIIWVDRGSVSNANGRSAWGSNLMIDAIEAIAWTIQTDVPKGNIEKIVRQGDCILFKKIDTNIKPCGVRHLTAQEYKDLLVIES